MDIVKFIKNTNWPTNHLPAPVKKTLRFMIVGNAGSFVQTGFFLLLMLPLGNPAEYTGLWYLAFAGGFILEMVPNYFLTCWYTFEARPNKTNASGFILARSLNLVMQMVILPASKVWLSGMNDGLISLIVIFVAGILNFTIQYLFFGKSKRQKK